MNQYFLALENFNSIPTKISNFFKLQCICMKFQPQNRFKVPVGTKFYRVKAKPWRPDSGARGTSSTAST